MNLASTHTHTQKKIKVEKIWLERGSNLRPACQPRTTSLLNPFSLIQLHCYTLIPDWLKNLTCLTIQEMFTGIVYTDKQEIDNQIRVKLIQHQLRIK